MKNHTILKKNMKSYYLALAATTMAKSLPHAILTVLLFSKGLNISQILFIQGLYNFAIMVCEVPSGILSDRYSRKRVYQLSNLALLTMAIIVLLGQGVLWMAIAWIIYGIADAFYSGTTESAIVNQIKKEEKHYEKKIVRFFRRSNQLTMVAMIFGGSVGSFLYFQLGAQLYIFSILLILFAGWSILFGFKEIISEAEEKEHIFQQIKRGIKEVQEDKRLVLLILLALTGQLFFQSHFQLWQAFVLELGFPETALFWFYLTFQEIGLVSYSLPISVHIQKPMMFGMVGGLFLPVILMSAHFYLSLAAYLLFTLLFTFLDYMYNALFSVHISPQRISMLTAVNATISRGGSFLFLVINSFLLQIFSVKTVVAINFEIALLLTIFLMFALWKAGIYKASRL